MKVVLIGAGNVASVLGRLISNAGHRILQICNRSAGHGKALATELNASFVSSISDIDRDADLYIISVSDSGISTLTKNLQLGDKLVTHTAGSVPMDALKGVSENYGILYPLQSIRKEITQLPLVPVLVDGNTEVNRSILLHFASSFSSMVKNANDKERSKLHLAAVISNNFSNYLFTLAEKYCEREGIDFKLILPLLEETVARLNHHSAAALQTGPAIRKDWQTISKHELMLTDYPQILAFYKLFTEQIAGGTHTNLS